MKKRFAILIIGFLLAAANAFAADGDLIVNGKLGVGTTSPGATLDVKGATAGTNMWLRGASGQTTNYLSMYEFTGHQWNIGNYNTADFVIFKNGMAPGQFYLQSNTGNVGIGTTNPEHKLTVNGVIGVSDDTWHSSDIRYKKNIMLLNTLLDKILKLKAVNYEWKKDEFKAMNFSNGSQIGLLAQDVEKIFPDIVRTNSDGYKAISYAKLSVLLMKGIQELAGAIDITQASTATPSIQSFYQGTTPALTIDTAGNIKTSGTISTDSISAKEIKIASGNVSISQSGDITVKNIISGDITTTGRITSKGELSAGDIRSSGSIAANGNIIQTSPDSDNYGISMERTDEENKYHNWTFWHMNDKSNSKNDLQIWEYKANSKKEACTATGISCNPRIVLKEGGNVGIGSDPGNYKLYVDGDLSVNGDTYSKGGQWLLLSDIRAKENITVIDSPLAKILNIDGVSFKWKQAEFKGKNIPSGTHYGLIAQQIEKVLPEVVKEDPAGNKNVAYTEIIPVLIEAMKEQQKVIEQYKSKQSELEERLKKLEKGG